MTTNDIYVTNKLIEVIWSHLRSFGFILRGQNFLYYKHATLAVLFCGVSETVNQHFVCENCEIKAKIAEVICPKNSIQKLIWILTRILITLQLEFWTKKQVTTELEKFEISIRFFLVQNSTSTILTIKVADFDYQIFPRAHSKRNKIIVFVTFCGIFETIFALIDHSEQP